MLLYKYSHTVHTFCSDPVTGGVAVALSRSRDAVEKLEPDPDADVHALKYEPDERDDEAELERESATPPLPPRLLSADARRRLALGARRWRTVGGIARTASEMMSMA